MDAILPAGSFDADIIKPAKAPQIAKVFRNGCGVVGLAHLCGEIHVQGRARHDY